MSDHRIDNRVQPERRGGRIAKIAGLALGIVTFGVTGLSGALAQTDDDAVSVSGGVSIFDETSPGSVEDLIDTIFAEVFGTASDIGSVEETDDGDINVGGNMGGSVTTGGSGGSGGGGITVGGTDSGG